MHKVALPQPNDFDAWRDAARKFLLAGVPPDRVIWQSGETGDLFSSDAPMPDMTGTFSVPGAFIELARNAICHRDPERFALLYTLLWRLRDNRALIADHADPLVRRIDELAKTVRRDIHKMRAFVRFREVEERFVAWFEPDHHIVRANAGFFVRRYAAMRWSIMTPDLSIHWNDKTLREGPGGERRDVPADDAIEEMWKTYYASIFNPARVKINAMTKEMPKKYWKNMPETALIAGLIATARSRELAMIEENSTNEGVSFATQSQPRARIGTAGIAEPRTPEKI